MKVGYNRKTYAEQRNIINAIDGVNYVKASNYKLVLTNINKKILNYLLLERYIQSKEYTFHFDDFNLNSVDILHFFNHISYGKTPWVTTFETIIPRSVKSHAILNSPDDVSLDLKKDKYILEALSRLAGNPCKKLIALSECTLNLQKAFLEHFPEYYEKITEKLVCIHPPQRCQLNIWNDKQLSINGEIRFMFVGGLFFVKGGSEILEVFKKYKLNGYNIKLTIISGLLSDDYATHTNEMDSANAKEFIKINSDWIDYFKYLPNKDVLELMRTSHIGLLPTYADTYGYSVLEFQASGCPVITTNIRALPEINNNNIGWIIQLPKNKLGGAEYSSTLERKELSVLIKKGLGNAIEDIFNNKNIIIEKSNAAINQIKLNHSPKKFSDKINKIYKDAITDQNNF